MDNNLKIKVIGCDHGSDMNFNVPSAHLGLIEFPLTQTESVSSFSLLNSKDAYYYASKELFIEYINSYFSRNFGIEMVESSIESIYSLKDNFDFLYPIGSFGEDFNSINELRFKRSVNITNNISDVLHTYRQSLENIIQSHFNIEQSLNKDYILKEFKYPINTAVVLAGGPHIECIGYFFNENV
jgi:hypothetical protein